MFDVKDSDFFDMEDDAFDTIVEDDISFTGSIKMQKPFLIRGKITGKIDTQSDLVVDTNAVVEADIKAARVLIRGKVKGNVHGEKLIFVTSFAHSGQISFLLRFRVTHSFSSNLSIISFAHSGQIPQWCKFRITHSSNFIFLKFIVTTFSIIVSKANMAKWQEF